jgi:hypothetical protein
MTATRQFHAHEGHLRVPSPRRSRPDQAYFATATFDDRPSEPGDLDGLRRGKREREQIL